MALPRASNPFRIPKQIRHYSRLPCEIPSTAPHGPHRLPTTTSTGPNTSRPFHSTPSLPAAPRSPRIRRAEARRAQLGGVFSDDGLYRGGVTNDISPRLEGLEKFGPKLWRQSIVEGFVDEHVDRRLFMHIATGVLTKARREPPSAAAVRELCDSPDIVFQIGNVVSSGNASLLQWIISSTAQAGAIIPTLMSGGQALNLADMNGSKIPATSAIFDRIEELAYKHHDPRAMLIQATLLGHKKRYDDALALTESVMSMIRPSATPPAPSRTMSLPGVKSPWSIYMWLKREAGAPESEVLEILKTGALEYQDPSALVTYAEHMMTQNNDLDKYEEYIAKAATSGHKAACRKLANYYYLTSQGRFPRRGTHSTDPEGDLARANATTSSRGKLGAFLSSLFGPQPYHEYRGLAIEWYELAFRHGCPRAALALAILMRQNGDDRELVEQVFQFAVSSKELGGVVRSFRVNWAREDFEPTVPEELLDV